MDTGLKGKVVVLTGPAKNIGQDIARALKANGATVIGVDIADMGEVADSLEAQYTIDVSDPASVEKGCKEILEAYPKIDVLVNNAALYGGLKAAPMDKLDLDEWDKVMAVNAKGPYLMIRGLLDGLKAAKASVINVSSGSALRGSPMLTHYVASKAAVMGLTRCLATELGMEGIRVNAVSPGLIDTESSQSLASSEMYQKMIEGTVMAQSLKEPLKAQDVVGTVLYLASDWSSAVTGQLCRVDRGMTKS